MGPAVLALALALDVEEHGLVLYEEFLDQVEVLTVKDAVEDELVAEGVPDAVCSVGDALSSVGGDRRSHCSRLALSPQKPLLRPQITRYQRTMTKQKIVNDEGV